jgi:hypothetical protein
MRKPLGLGLLGAVAVTSLAFASSAFGAYAPKLSITAADEVTSIEFSQTDADDATAKVTILSPAGFTTGFTQAPGTTLGTLDGSVIAGAFGGATVPVAGTIVAGDTSNAALRQTAKTCTGTEDHAAIWLLNVTAAGQSLPAPVPLFVDPVGTPPLSAFASASIQLCLPPPPAASFQIKLLEASLHIGNTLNIFAPPATAGAYRWTAINTPYKADNTPNAAGTVETQGIEASPVDPSFTAKRITKTRRVKHKRYTDLFFSYSVRLSGTLQAGGEAVGGANVDLFSGPTTKIDTTTTNDSGAFTKTMKLTKTTAYHAVYLKDATVLAGGTCVPPLELLPGVDMPCPNVTSGGLTATTEEVRVVKPKLTHKRIKRKKGPKH